MYNTINKKINKVKFKKIFIFKFKIKNIILKSMFYNRNLNTNYRVYSLFLLNKQTQLNKKYYKLCKFSGYKKNVNKYLDLGRHELNRSAIIGRLQNVTINSW